MREGAGRGGREQGSAAGKRHGVGVSRSCSVVCGNANARARDDDRNGRTRGAKQEGKKMEQRGGTRAQSGRRCEKKRGKKGKKERKKERKRRWLVRRARSPARETSES
eukprot:276841-Rhodomonas_salina.1